MNQLSRVIVFLLSVSMASLSFARVQSQNPNATDLANEIVHIIGEKDVQSDQAKAVAWFKANYKTIINSEVTLKNLNDCHENAMSNSQMIGCSFMDARRNFALGWDTFVEAEKLVNSLTTNVPASEKQEWESKKQALLGHLNQSKNTWLNMVPKVCTLDSHQMLGGTGSYLILYGCFGSEAKEIREDLLKAMGIVYRLKEKSVDPLVDARLVEFAEEGFADGLTNVGASFAFKNFNEKYQQLLMDSSDFIDVSDFYDLPMQYENSWNSFRVEYCNGYGSLMGMYASSLQKGNPWSTVSVATAYCNSERSRNQSNKLYQMSVQIGGM